MTWPLVEIGQFMAKRNGSVNPSKFRDETFELYSVPAFDSRSPEILQGRDIGSSKQNIQERDVLLSKIVPHIRRAWVVGRHTKYRQIGSGEWIVFRGDDFDPHYLRHLVISDWFNASFMRTVSGVGGSLLRARPAEVSKIKIPFPPLPEQRRIAAILDKADELRQKRRQAIEKLDQLLQSVFLDMFGDPVTNPKGFDRRVLSEFYIDPKRGTKCGPFGSALKKHEYTETGVPVWSMGNITLKGEFIDTPTLWTTETKFVTLEPYSVQSGDVIISRAGTVGKMGVVRSESPNSIISTNLIRVRFGQNLLPEYFVSLMTYCKHRLGRLKTGPDGAFTHMNTGILDSLEFPYPPIELQKKYVDSLDCLKTEVQRHLEARNKADAFFSSLQQRAFSGTL